MTVSPHVPRRPTDAGAKRTSRWIALFAAVILLSGGLAYHNSLGGPFVFDDVDSIADNPTIRRLWPLGPVLAPPAGGLTVDGRPVLNLTLACNYAISGTQVWSYHVVNLAIHLLAGLTLFGLVRRILSAIDLRPATALGFAVALLWTVHPLQTESVTYVIQRAESLMGLLYLLTVYCFVRSVGPREVAPARAAGPSGAIPRLRPNPWALLSALCCLLGMGTKEVMVSAPLVVLLCDRTFFAGSFRAAWTTRRLYYLGLAGTWLVLGYLVHSTHGRGGTAGFGSGVPGSIYWLTQFPAVVHYIWLSFWPHPLVFDYAFDRFWIWHPAATIPCVLIIVAIAAGTLVGVLRRSATGFLGVCFFAILAPTSVLPGNRQALAEHRMYLALAAVLVFAVVGLWQAVGGVRRLHRSGESDGIRLPVAGWTRGRFLVGAAVSVALVFAWLTESRNRTYQSALALWSDTVARVPDNPYAHNSLASALFEAGDTIAAKEHLLAALKINPEYAQAHANLGGAFTRLGLPDEAMAEYSQALRLSPDDPKMHHFHGLSLARFGRPEEAMAEYAAALRLRPDFAEAQFGWGTALMAESREQEAAEHLAAAVRLRPDFPDAHNNLGNALADLGRLAESAAEYAEAIRLRPDDAGAHNNLGIVFAQMERSEDALDQFARALKLNPAASEIHNNYGSALWHVGRVVEARAQFAEALRLDPQFAKARDNLARLDAAEPLP